MQTTIPPGTPQIVFRRFLMTLRRTDASGSPAASGLMIIQTPSPASMTPPTIPPKKSLALQVSSFADLVLNRSVPDMRSIHVVGIGNALYQKRCLV